jgi:hypothetical protein
VVAVGCVKLEVTAGWLDIWDASDPKEYEAMHVRNDNIALTKLQLSNPHSCRVGDIILNPGMNLVIISSDVASPIL